MTRFAAGLLTGLAGAVLFVILTLVSVPYVPLLVPLVAGSVAGGAGALAGLLAGAALLVASIVVGIVMVNSGSAQHAISVVEATATTRASTGATSGSKIPLAQVVRIGLVVGSCFIGGISLGLSVAAGAIAGAFSGRHTVVPGSASDGGSLWTPPDTRTSPSGGAPLRHD